MAHPSAVSRALIVDGGKVLLIHRFKDGREYYVVPGGHIESGESEEAALVREIKEETGLDIVIDRRLWTLHNPYDRSEHHFFLVKKFSGKMSLGGPEAESDCENNKYILEWHDLREIPRLNLVPEPLKEKVLGSFPG